LNIGGALLRRRISIICLTLIFSFSLLKLPVHGIEQTPDARLGLPYEYTPQEGSVEELYKDIIATLIQPYISDEIKKYYGSPYLYDLFSMKFLRIDRPYGYRSFAFKIKVEVQPFIGAHNTVGIDEMTINLEGGRPKVENFKHIKSFPIPKYLQ
jgi:hypothetical protein